MSEQLVCAIEAMEAALTEETFEPATVREILDRESEAAREAVRQAIRDVMPGTGSEQLVIV